jgi:iron complex outermembrane recepter protein
MEGPYRIRLLGAKYIGVMKATPRTGCIRWMRYVLGFDAKIRGQDERDRPEQASLDPRQGAAERRSDKQFLLLHISRMVVSDPEHLGGIMTRRLSLRIGVAACAAAAFASSALAEDPASDIIVTAQQKKKQVVSDGSVGVLGPKKALETPFNITSYTSKLILDQQAQTIGKVLENDPSVRTTFGSGNQSELFVIRGFPLTGDDVAINGLFGVSPRQIVSPELYESVQVLNGANAFLFGAAPGGSGIGGGINLIPKRAEKTLLRVTANYDGGSLYGGSLDLASRFGGEKMFGVRLNGVYRSGGTEIDRERRRVRALGADFDFHRGPARLFVDFGYENQQAFQARPELRLASSSVTVPKPPAPSANYGQPWSFTRLRDLYLIARGEIDLTDSVMAYASGGFRSAHESGDYSTLTVTNGDTGAASQSRLYVPRRDHNQSATAGIRGRLNIDGLSNEFNVGGSINLAENRNAYAFGAFTAANGGTNPKGVSTSFNTNLYDPRIVARPSNGSTGGDLENLPKVATSDFKSLYFSDTIGAFGDRLLLTGGAREQGLVVNGFNRSSLLRTSHYDKNALTPVVGIVLRPTRTLSLYFNRVEGLAQGPTAPTNATTLNPGEIFPPFRSLQYEVGGKVEIRGLTSTLAFYRTTQPNAFAKPTPVTGNPTATTYVVDGRQRNQGIEFSLNGEATDWLRIIGGFSINDAVQRMTLGGATNGKNAIGVPGFQANVGVEIVPPFLKAATLTGRVVQTDHQYLDNANLQRIPGWTRFDIGARYVLVAERHPITFRLAAENVANRRFWYSAFGGYLVQASPRTIRASVTFEY